MDNVRVTVSIRNQRNSRRFTLHKDVSLKDAKKAAAEMADDAATFFAKKGVAVAESDE